MHVLVSCGATAALTLVCRSEVAVDANGHFGDIRATAIAFLAIGNTAIMALSADCQ
jgi:hypothetical protein